MHLTHYTLHIAITKTWEIQKVFNILNDICQGRAPPFNDRTLALLHQMQYVILHLKHYTINLKHCILHLTHNLSHYILFIVSFTLNLTHCITYIASYTEKMRIPKNRRPLKYYNMNHENDLREAEQKLSWNFPKA